MADRKRLDRRRFGTSLTFDHLVEVFNALEDRVARLEEAGGENGIGSKLAPGSKGW